MRRHSALVAILVVCLHVPASSAQPGSRLEWVHRSWTIEDGLPQNTVTAIAQTADRYLWLGTVKGLVRFDGLRFVGFETATATGLAGDRITVLEAGTNGDLWIGTEQGGVSRYDGHRFIDLAEKGLGGVDYVYDIEIGPGVDCLT